MPPYGRCPQALCGSSPAGRMRRRDLGAACPPVRGSVAGAASCGGFECTVTGVSLNARAQLHIIVGSHIIHTNWLGYWAQQERSVPMTKDSLMDSLTLTRRQALAGVAALGAASAFGLSACSDESAPAGSAAAGGEVEETVTKIDAEAYDALVAEGPWPTTPPSPRTHGLPPSRRRAPCAWAASRPPRSSPSWTRPTASSAASTPACSSF